MWWVGRLLSFMLKEEEAQGIEEAPGIFLPPSQCPRWLPWCLPCQGWVLQWQEAFWSPTAEAGRQLPVQAARGAAAVQAAQMRAASLPGSVRKPEPGCQHRGRQRLIDHSHFLAVHQASLPESSERFCLDVQVWRKKKKKSIYLEGPSQKNAKEINTAI